MDRPIKTVFKGIHSFIAKHISGEIIEKECPVDFRDDGAFLRFDAIWITPRRGDTLIQFSMNGEVHYEFTTHYINPGDTLYINGLTGEIEIKLV